MRRLTTSFVTVGHMVRRRRQTPPASWVRAGSWPEAELARDAPPEAHVAQSIVKRLNTALVERSVRSLAEEADLAHTTVYDLLAGRTYGDVITIARLEAALNVRLWPEL